MESHQRGRRGSSLHRPEYSSLSEDEHLEREYRTYLVDLCFQDGGEIDVELLDDAWVQTVEIHDQDICIPEPSFWIKDETTFVLVFLGLGCNLSSSVFSVLGFFLDLRLYVCCSSLLCPSFIWTYVLETMEFVEQNVFVPFRTTSIKCFVP